MHESKLWTMALAICELIQAKLFITELEYDTTGKATL